MLKTTTVGSFPRKDKQKDTLRKSTVTDEEAFEMIKDYNGDTRILAVQM